MVHRLLGNLLLHWTRGPEKSPMGPDSLTPLPSTLCHQGDALDRPPHTQLYYTPDRHLPSRALTKHRSPSHQKLEGVGLWGQRNLG